MIYYIFILPILSLIQFNSSEERIINYRGDDYNTTISVDSKFIGIYKGRKTGYLELKKDGTGTYKYDLFGYAPSTCKRQAITIEWGFVLDDKGEIQKRKREYGFSYTILLKSTSETTFQGCRTPVMMDYILDKNGVLNVSSSDDWKR